MIPNEPQDDKPFYIMSGQENQKTCEGQFDIDNECYFEATINATGETNKGYDIFFIGNSTNPNVETVESQRQTVGIQEEGMVHGNPTLDIFQDHQIMPELPTITIDNLDLVPRFTQNIEFSIGETRAGRVIGEFHTQIINLDSPPEFGEEDWEEKFIIPTETGAEPFFVQSGDQPSYKEGSVEPGDEIHLDTTINATGEEQTQYEVFLLGNSSNPNVETVHSNNQTVGIYDSQNPSGTVLLDLFDGREFDLGITQVMTDTVDLVPSLTQGIEIGIGDTRAGRIIGDGMTMDILIGSWKPIENESIQDKGFILPTEPDPDYPMYVQEGPQPQSHQEQIEPRWETEFEHRVNVTGEPANYEVFYIGNASNPNVETTESRRHEIQVREQQDADIQDFTLHLVREELQGILGETTVNNIVDIGFSQTLNPVTGMDMTSGRIITTGVTQIIEAPETIDQTYDLGREFLQTFNVLGQGEDTWKPLETATQITGIGTDTDSNIIIDRMVDVPVIGSFLQDDNVSPTINRVDLEVEELGYTNNVTLLVNATDPDGQDDLETIEFQGDTQQLELEEDEEIIEFNLEDQLVGQEEVIVEDSVGHTDEYEIGYEITDNNWEQETETITLDEQHISKEDTIENTGDTDFDYTVTHSVFHDRTETEHERGNISGTLEPEETDTLSTEIEGNYLEQNLGNWTQDHREQSTEETQFISKRLSIENLPDTVWENIEVHEVENPEGFNDCDACSETTIDQFSGNFNDDHYWQDTGDIVQTEMTGTIEDFEIGERDSYFEQYEYNQIHDSVNLTQIQAETQIDDEETEYGGYFTVQENESWNAGITEPVQTPACDTSDTDFTETEYNNETWNTCSKDLTGNERPDYFKTIIPSLDPDQPQQIRLGGFIGLPPEEERDPFPGLREDCENGETFGDLECYRNEWRPADQTTRTASIVDSELGELSEGLGILIALLIILAYIGVRNWRGENQ